MDHQRTDQVRSVSGQPQADAGAEGVPNDVGGAGMGLFDQRSEIGDVVAHAALRRQPLALTVTTTVVSDDGVILGQPGRNEVPVVVVAPRAMHHHDRGAARALRVSEQVDAVHLHHRHVHPITPNRRAQGPVGHGERISPSEYVNSLFAVFLGWICGVIGCVVRWG